MQLRLDGVRKDEIGWLARFYAKPDMHSNSFEIPVSEETVHKLELGKQYTFVLVEQYADAT